MTLPTLAELDNAAALVYAAMPPTPQFSWPLLNAELGVEAWIKHDNHTLAGNFKVRGGIVYMDALLRRQPDVRGVIAATRGNHGQSVAWSARNAGLSATLVVPRGNSVEKNAAMVGFGGILVEHGGDFQESRDHAHLLAEREGLHMVPSYHHDLVAGVASCYMELLRAQPDLDLLLVPIGQGSGICGAVAARDALGLSTRIVGVVSSHALAYQKSFYARRKIDSPVTTVLADGLACRVANDESLAVVLASVDDVLAVTDDEVARAMRLYYRATHNLAEGAGAAALAAALQLRDEGMLTARKIGLPLTGGNVDASVFRNVLQGP